ncbi:MFS transporter [Nonomuraea gerenzanensis]|uniref:Integral membrane transport protein n=1 Tax=Nonomuraea gerenzanensis TaxID=93944 RepID=A0A1M4ENG8_9ACTN|nr:MFS transporter [Nonomuraea gerenzanensis]UBU11880.1 MFS transporter [Nonomuraea gerenzanensis]SBP00391.1 integral membrane transport protein [Nonomuraea gerenzanensis]
MTVTEVSVQARWLAVTSVAVGTFTVVTSEMLPIGLLTSMAGDLGVSAGTAGLAMSAPGLVAALAAPVLAVLARRADRRLVLLGLMALLAVANLAAAAAPNHPVMLAARVLTGVSIGGFWAFAAGIGARLVPEPAVGRATSIILGGVSVASVLGVPAATFVSSFAGWRSAFAAAGVLALALLAVLATSLPPLKPPAEPESSPVPEKRSSWLSGPLKLVLVLTTLAVSGHFVAYTYVRPFLEEVAHAGPALVSSALLLYGAAGVAGNFAAGARAARNPRLTLVTLAALMAAAMAALVLTGVPALVALVVWGLGYGGVGVTLQLWIMRSGGGELGTALFVGAFNVSIALGAFAGGRIADGLSVPAVMAAGAGLALAAAVVAAVAGRTRAGGGAGTAGSDGGGGSEAGGGGVSAGGAGSEGRSRRSGS